MLIFYYFNCTLSKPYNNYIKMLIFKPNKAKTLKKLNLNFKFCNK